MSKVDKKFFHKDHWSLLAYVEACCVDRNVSKDSGRLQHSRMRCNSEIHPLLNTNGFQWKQDWGTRVKNADGEIERLLEHDDWDCLDDLEAQGWVEVVNTTQGVVKLTSAGRKVAEQLRKHKATGGMFANFVLF